MCASTIPVEQSSQRAAGKVASDSLKHKKKLKDEQVIVPKRNY